MGRQIAIVFLVIGLSIGLGSGQSLVEIVQNTGIAFLIAAAIALFIVAQRPHQ